MLVLVALPHAAGALTQDEINAAAETAANEIFERQFAPRIQDSIPIVASSTGFTFRLDPELGVWERVGLTTGPIRLERAEPLGAGRLDVNLSYAFIDFKKFTGRSLRSGLRTTFGGSTVVFRVNEAQAQVLDLAVGYGLTDRLEFALILPLEWVSFRARFLSDNPSLSPTVSSDRDNVGLGDIVLRAKQQVLETQYANVAAGLELKLPTGDKKKALGLGDTLVDPGVYVSRNFNERIEPHVNLGFEINAAEVDRSRFRYGFGLAYQVLQSRTAFLRSVGLVFDVIARVDLNPPEKRQTLFFGRLRQRNIMDFAPGLKIALGDRSLLFASVEVPLGDDGLRADIVPLGGAEITF